MAVTPAQGVALFYLDSNVVIYAIERPRPRSDGQHRFLTALDTGAIRGCTSELTLAECLAGPLASGNAGLASLYTEFLTDRRYFRVLPISRTILVHAAELRAHSRATLADAIHIATALSSGATSVVTNDRRIRTPSWIEMIGGHELDWT